MSDPEIQQTNKNLMNNMIDDSEKNKSDVKPSGYGRW